MSLELTRGGLAVAFAGKRGHGLAAVAGCNKTATRAAAGRRNANVFIDGLVDQEVDMLDVLWTPL